MSKHLVDGSEVWRESWYNQFDPNTKLSYRYIYDHCDSSGIWIIDEPVFSIKTGILNSFSKILKAFGDQSIALAEGKKLFLPFYIRSTYKHASDSYKAKIGARKILEFYGVLDYVRDVFDRLPNTNHGSNRPRSSLLYVLDLNSFRISEGKGEFEGKTKEEILEEIYKLYPRKLGKATGINNLIETVHTASDLEFFLKAVNNYSTDCAKKGTEEKYIKHFSTFVGPIDKPSWRDWVDYTFSAGAKPKRDYSFLKEEGAP